jgi:hypothetical protein
LPPVCSLGALVGAPEPAQALPSVEVRCPSLSSEQTAEVEARALAELMTNGTFVVHAELECSFNRVTVAVSSETASVVESAALQDPNVRDALIETLYAALLRALYPADAPPPRARSATAFEPVDDSPHPPPAGPSPARVAPPLPSRYASPSPLPAPPPIPSEAPRDTAPPTQRSPRTAHVSAGPLVEWWQGQTAVGAVLEAAYGPREVSFALRLSALSSLSPAESFDALELSAAASVRWLPDWAYGLLFSSGLGVSWLDVSPQAPYEPRGATTVAAGLASLELSRPTWFGAWVLVPAAGLRLFAGERTVTLDGRDELVIGHFTPNVGARFGRAFE